MRSSVQLYDVPCRGKWAGALFFACLTFLWIFPVEGGCSKELQALLKQNQCQLHARIAAYEGASMKASRTAPLDTADDATSVAFQDARWQCRTRTESVADRPDAVDLYIDFRLVEGQAKQTAVNVELAFAGWSVDNYVLLPGSAYNGNRFRAVRMSYPPYPVDPQFHKVDLPITVTDIPRLNTDRGESIIEQQTGNLSTPAMGFQSPRTKRGFWLLTQQRNRFGNLGMSVKENDDRSEAVYQVGSPCVRKMLFKDFAMAPSLDRAADWKTGDEISLRLRLYFFAAPTVQDLFDRFFAIRKDVVIAGELPNVLPWSAAFEIITPAMNRDKWDSEGYYRGPVSPYELGWNAGGINTYALLFAGDALTRSRALASLDFDFRNSQASSGLFYGVWHKGKWYSDDPVNASALLLRRNMHLIRRDADLLYFFLKQFLLLKARGTPEAVPAAWEQAVHRQADALVALWNRYGQFGQWVDVETGEIVVGGTTCGALMPAALALAGQYFNEPKYVEVAKAAGEFYFQRDVRAGVTTGGPGDVLQSPDYESAFHMLESFVVLYETTAGRKWLARAEDMARQCASWVVSYDYVFPPKSTLAKLDIKTTGCCWASAQNKVPVPGLCTMSGDCLLKLFRATGNSAYLDLLRDIAHAPAQCLSREDRPVPLVQNGQLMGNLPSGWMNWSVQMGDRFVADEGEFYYGWSYCTISQMLIWCEVPGLYIQPDAGIACALDHIKAKVVARNGGELKVELSNPTKFAARVRVVAETSADALAPLGWNALLNRPVIALAPGETKTFAFRGARAPEEVR
jgi:hypothetical protein